MAPVSCVTIMKLKDVCVRLPASHVAVPEIGGFHFAMHTLTTTEARYTTHADRR